MSAALDTVQTIREQAAQRFAQLGWPTPRLEEWKFTSVAPIAQREWKLADSAPAAFDTHAASMSGRAAVELVFVNGWLAAKHGDGGQVVRTLRHPERADAKGLVDEARSSLPRSFAVSAAQDDGLDHYARYADYQRHPFTALNTANAQDGGLVVVPRGFHGLIHLLFVGTDGYASHPRNLIVVERGAQAEIVETYVGSGKYFTNAVTELVAGDGAVVDHVKIECESPQAFHVGTLQVHQQRSSAVTSHTISIGGALVRNEINAALAGEGAGIVLDGLFVTGESQHVDNHTVIDHLKPHCESLELYKGVLDGSSRGIFDGKVIVRPDARKTVSRQTNNNLLLSESAVVDSKPTLEILNDDVKCNHGSTIGQLEEEPMFYLRSRGIGEAEARNLLVYAFAGEIVDRIKIEPARELVRRAMFARLPERLPERREKGR